MKLKRTNFVSSIITFIGLVATLSMVVFLIVAATLIQQATGAVKTSTYESSTYQQLFSAFAKEEALRSEYVLHPTTALRNDHLAIATTISHLAHTLQQGFDAIDSTLGERIFVQQASYLSDSGQFFAAIDARNFASANAIDSKIDPFFRQIEQDIKKQASIDTTETTQALEQLTLLERTISVIGYCTLVTGLPFVGISMYVSRSYRRRLDEAMQAEIGRLERLAFTDQLTGLGNHFAYQEQLTLTLEEAHRSRKELVLALLDIDEFKVFNDEQGHQRGDDLLSSITALLHDTRLSEASFRLNADDFALILPQTSLAEANVALERLREDVQRRLGGVTVSIGIAHTVSDELTREALQAQAAVALQEAKRRGRNRVVAFARIAGSVSMVPLEKTRAVRRLLSERKVAVAFQPIWDLATGRVLAYEGLIRPNASYGLSGPQELFDVVEQIGRAHELDVICVQAILTRATELPPDALLFLNLSPQSLVHDLLSGATLLEAAVSAGLEPSRVVLEITERSIV